MMNVGSKFLKPRPLVSPGKWSILFFSPMRNMNTSKRIERAYSGCLGYLNKGTLITLTKRVLV